MTTLNIVKYLNKSWRRISQNRLSGSIIRIDRNVTSISTVDIKKNEHFSAMENIWWIENGPIKALHTYSPLEIKLIKDGLINAGVKIENSDLPLKGIKILDVGCGGGIITEALARAGAQVTGIDVCAELINIAKEHLKLHPDIAERVNYIHTTIEDFAQNERKNSAYDAVVVCHVLQYVMNQQLFLKKCLEILKPGKSIFITTINKTLISWLSTVVVTEYITGNIPRGTLEWHKFIAPDKLQQILKNYGCETRSIYGIKLYPLIRQWAWSSNTSTFYGFHAIKREKISL